MNIQELFLDKSLKPKDLTGIIVQMIWGKAVSIEDLAAFATDAKDPAKATCIEAIEHVTLKSPEVMSLSAMEFIIRSLPSKAPRVRWEAARVIANTIHLFPGLVEPAAAALLANTEHPGTVVRWSAAGALASILKMKTAINTDLLPAVEAIIRREEKNSIRKIYQSAINHP